MKILNRILLHLTAICLFVPWTKVVCQNIVIDINIPGIIVIEPTTEAPNRVSKAQSTDTLDSGDTMVTDVSTQTLDITTEMPEQETDSTEINRSSSPDLSTISSLEEVSLPANQTMGIEVVTGGSSSGGAVPSFPAEGIPCIKETHEGCNLTNLERCVYIRERAPRCVCLIGYARATDGISCIAVEQYMIILPTQVLYTPDLQDKASEEYRLLEFNARDTLIRSLGRSSLASIAMDAQVVDIGRAEDGTTLIKFKMDVSREYAPTQEMVGEELKKGLQDVVNTGESGVTISTEDILNLEVSAPDPCVDPLLNHCDITATCTRGRRGFLCTCPDGTSDISYNRGEAPGEMCTDSPCECSNGGFCDVNTIGDVICRCAQWYLGAHCDIDGKALLIIMCCLFGTALCATVLLCGFCYYSGRCKRSKRNRRSNLVIPYTINHKRRPQNYYYAGYNTHHINYQPRLINYWQRPTNALYTVRKPSPDYWQWLPK